MLIVNLNVWCIVVTPCIAKETAAHGTSLPLDLHEGAHVWRAGTAVFAVHHFDLLLVEEAGGEVDISDVDVVWHVLAEGVGWVLTGIEFVVDLTVHALVKIELADVSILDFLHILSKLFIAKFPLLLDNLLHLLFQVIDLALIPVNVLLVC